MKKFHTLKVVAKERETEDSVRLSIDVPEALREDFEFLPGQHLPIQVEQDGRKLRRTYSICSPKGEWPLQIGVRVQPGGRFSEYAAYEMAVGDELAVMPPNGQFHVDPNAPGGRCYLGVAAGSGITPLLSIIASVLEGDPDSRFILFYGNRKQRSTMFIEDLYALKNRFPERLQLHFVFSQEEQEFPVAAGRIDADKLPELYEHFCRGTIIDEAFVCGPDSMIDDVTAALVDCGVPAERVHAERFGAPRRGTKKAHAVSESTDTAEITVIMDGHKKSFAMPRQGSSIVDAAASEGVELPYSCKGGVCATCRTHVREGEVHMETNYGLEPWEVEKGFVLACQSRPLSDQVLLDYDKS